MVDAVVGGLGKAAAFILGGALTALLAMPALAADEIKGEANVVSGNEILVGKRTVRLFGIAAPELKETCEINDAQVKCGIIAWAELIQLADGQVVSCDKEELPPGITAPDKSVEYATCYVSEADLNEAMVRSGWASAVTEQTDRYEVDEADAKESRRGLWAAGSKRRRR